MQIKARDLLSLSLLLSLLLFPAITAAQQGAPGGEWPDYGATWAAQSLRP